MRNTITTITLLGTIVAPPVSAQLSSNSVIAISRNDTTITIHRGDKESCEVKVGGKKLSKAASKPICDKQLKNMIFLGNEPEAISVQLKALRGLMSDSELILPDSLASLADRQRALASKLQSMSLALVPDGQNPAPGMVSLSPYSVLGLDGQVVGRTVIGVTVNAQAQDTDKYGAVVVGVTPNGPADKAGIKVKDIIAKVDGKAVADKPERPVDKGESSTWIRLIEIVGKLDPDKPVKVEYRRNGSYKVTTVTPTTENRLTYAMISPDGKLKSYLYGKNGESVLAMRPSTEPKWFSEAEPLVPRDARLSDSIFAVSPGSRSFFAFGRFSNLELAALNEKLGSYFGTSEGVLVIDVQDSDQQLGLEPGDVVTSVDGRSVDTPSEMLRALRSYNSGESVTLKIVRNRRPISLTRLLP